MILVANVGNRNITLRGEDIPTLAKAQKVSYAKFTEQLYNQGDFSEVRVAILDKILDQYQGSIDKLILIGSDQPDTTKNDQDSIYTTEILKRILIENSRWPHLDVEIYELHKNLHHTSEVMKWYKYFWINLLNLEPLADFLICDAGGATQMKTPLKIMAEYTVPIHRLHVKYVDQRTGEVSEVEQLEYRKVVASLQIEVLVDRLNYDAADLLWQNHVTSESAQQSISLLIQLGRALKYSILSDVNSILSRLKEEHSLEIGEWVKQTLMQKSESMAMNPSHLKLAKIKLALLNVYLADKSANEFTLCLAQFYEFVMNAMIAQRFGFPVANETYQDKLKWERGMIKLGIVTEQKKGYCLSVPSRIKLLRTIGNIKVNSFLDELAPIGTSNEFKKIRDLLVHQGQAASMEKILLHCPDIGNTIDHWSALFGLPKPGLFEKINNDIKAQLKLA